MKYDWKKDGVEHLERAGCIINIRTGLNNRECQEVTSIEIIVEDGWKFEGSINNRMIKVVSK